MNFSGPVDEAPTFKKFLETEEGQKARADDRAEFKTLFDQDSEDEENVENSDEEKEMEEIVEEEKTKLSKKERKVLKKGAKDKVEEFSMNAF